jgi:hypothetical protein
MFRYVAHDNIQVIPKNSDECRSISNPKLAQYFSADGYFDEKRKTYLPNDKLRFMFPGPNFHSLCPIASQIEHEHQLKIRKKNNESTLTASSSSSSSTSATKSSSSSTPTLSSGDSLELFLMHGKTFSSSSSSTTTTTTSSAAASSGSSGSSSLGLQGTNNSYEMDDMDAEMIANAAARDEAEYSGFIGLSQALDEVLLTLDKQLDYST